jgi:Cu(I)/Ag(I) efflux system membrane protein CusA/SilA
MMIGRRPIVAFGNSTGDRQMLEYYLGYNFSVAVWVGYLALFGIAVETGVVVVVYLHEALDRKLAAGSAPQRGDIEQAAIEGANPRGPASKR